MNIPADRYRAFLDTWLVVEVALQHWRLLPPAVHSTHPAEPPVPERALLDTICN